MPPVLRCPKLGALHKALRRRGLAYVLLTLKRRWNYEKDTIYVFAMRLKDNSLEVPANIERIGSIEDLQEFVRERELEDPTWASGEYAEEIIERFAKGHWCYGLRMEGRVVSVIFVAADRCEISVVHKVLSLPYDTVAYYDVYTLERYRGQGLYSSLFRKCVSASLADGYSIAWMWIMPHNHSSLIAHDRLGMKDAFLEIVETQRWGLRYHRVRKVALTAQEIVSGTST